MDARGYTVLELLVVAGLIGALAALGAWRAAEWLPEQRLEAATRQVVLDLRLARGRALAEQRPTRLAFSLADGSYRPQQRVDGVFADSGPAVSLPPGIALAACSAPGDAIAFSPRGTASSFGSLALRNPRGRERRVIVDMVGRVRVS